MSVGKTFDAVLFLKENEEYDFSLDSSGDILTKAFFDTSILMSLFCERRALATEMPVANYRRGWIGNEEEDFEIGSKLWLYEQARLTRETLNGIDSVVKEALEWMVEDGIALEVSVSSELNGENKIAVNIIITKPNSKTERRYFELWENTGK